MRIIFKGGLFQADAPPDDVPLRKLGWKYIPPFKAWVTNELTRVVPVREFCVDDAQKRITAFSDKRRAAVAASVAATIDLEIPRGQGAIDAGHDYRGYQKAGVSFQSARKFSINADVPRLGKTIMAIGTANRVKNLRRMLAITPANAKLNWCREWNKWGAHPLEAGYCEGDHNPKTPFLSCNFEILSRHIHWIKEQEWDVVAIDEIHWLRNLRAVRTSLILNEEHSLDAVHHVMGFSGTPIWKSPKDLWPVLRRFDRKGLGYSKTGFKRRYCGATEDNGWDDGGQSNMDELQFRLRESIMIRREKSDVGEELPPNRQTIVLPKTGLSSLLRRERSLAQEQLAGLEQMIAQIERGDAQVIDEVLDRFGAMQSAYDELADDSMSTLRKELAMAKLPMVIDFVNEQLQSEPKVVVFVHHRDLGQALKRQYPDAAMVLGGLSTLQRDYQIYNLFRDTPGCRVMIANMAACGQAIPLDAADVAIFAEISWVPSELDQCEERIWAVGKPTPIQIFRLVVEDTLDETMLHVVTLRQKAIERATVAKHLVM